MKQKAHLIFSIFYLIFFGLLSSMGVSLFFVKGFTFDLLVATLFCALLTIVFGIRILRIRQKMILESNREGNKNWPPEIIGQREAS